jgi:Glyoxalase/Bleomycin resistance protein/Dioxygenase superfamily
MGWCRASPLRFVKRLEDDFQTNISRHRTGAPAGQGRAVGHVGIHVTDLDRSLVWYRDILGAHADRALAVWGWDFVPRHKGEAFGAAAILWYVRYFCRAEEATSMPLVPDIT